MDRRIGSSSRPTVLTRYPRAQRSGILDLLRAAQTRSRGPVASSPEGGDAILQARVTWARLCQSVGAVLLPHGALLKEDRPIRRRWIRFG